MGAKDFYKNTLQRCNICGKERWQCRAAFKNGESDHEFEPIIKKE